MNSNTFLFNHVEWHLTYDDVLKLPNYSEVTPPETDTLSELTQALY